MNTDFISGLFFFYWSWLVLASCTVSLSLLSLNLHILHFHFSSCRFVCLICVFQSASLFLRSSKLPLQFPFHLSILFIVCSRYNRTFRWVRTESGDQFFKLKWRIKSENVSVCVAFSGITHKGVFLCPRSIFRMFSSDRKRVETALENCNLPSGRVRHQNTEASLFLLSCCLLIFPPLSLNLLSLLLSFCFLSSSPSSFFFFSFFFFFFFFFIHLSFSLSSHRSACPLFSRNGSWLMLCSFVWSRIFRMSAWLPTQNWFSLGCNETNRPSGSNRDDKKADLSLPLFRYLWREAAPSCIEV